MRLCPGLFLVFLVFTSIVPALHGKNDVRICVPGSSTIKVKYCDLLANSKTHVTCVLAADRLECLRLVSERRAEFTLAMAEDLLFAKEVDFKSLLVVSEIRALQKEPYASKAVVVVRNDRNVTANLLGARLCHPGRERNSDKSTMFSQFLEERLAPQLCTSNVTLQEDRLLSTAVYFGKSCKAGPWVEDPLENSRLKETYGSLCALCDRADCSMSDKYWGAGGAATCLKDGVGDALWSTQADVRIYFQLQQSSDGNADYSYLCRNGSTMPLTAQEPCFWMARPWEVVVANIKAVVDVQKTLQILREDKVSSDWKENLLNVIESYLEYIVNLEAMKTPTDYLEGIPGFLSAGEMTGGNCQPPHEIKWCTLPGIEFKKCNWISKAASAYGIKPDITCVQRPSVEDCIKTVAAKEADVMVVPPDYIPIAKLEHKLNTMFFETSKTIDSSYSLSAYVKKDSSIRKPSDLKSRVACFTLHQGLGWRAALVALRNLSLVSEACNARGILHDFFGDICVSSGPDGVELPRCCDGTGAESDPDGAAMSCLAKGGCDVAFVRNTTLSPKSGTWNGESFRRICPDLDGKDCGWVRSPNSAVMTSADPQEVKYKEAFQVLSQLAEQFTRPRKKNNMMLSLFGQFQDESNVIFQDSSSGLTSPSNSMDSKWNQVRSLQYILDKTKYCSSSQKLLASIFFTLITAALLLSL